MNTNPLLMVVAIAVLSNFDIQPTAASGRSSLQILSFRLRWLKQPKSCGLYFAELIHFQERFEARYSYTQNQKIMKRIQASVGLLEGISKSSIVECSHSTILAATLLSTSVHCEAYSVGSEGYT